MSRSGTKPLQLDVLTLLPGGVQAFIADSHERALVLLSGGCAVRFGSGLLFDGLVRTNVFDARAAAVYAPRGQPFQIEAGPDGASMAVASTRASQELAPFRIDPERVQVEQRGRATWAREVHTIFGENAPMERLVIGETFSDGCWSSYPPHKHDGPASDGDDESLHDEVFLVKVRPASGFGLLLQFAAGEPEKAVVVRDGDVLVHPGGYHSFVAAGGHRLYYLWALSGAERTLRWRTDPRFTWLLEAGGR